jgi:integrase/recombinase XerD
MTSLAPLLQAFFTEHLTQRRSSPHTVASYRDAFRLLLAHAQHETGTSPARLQLGQIDAGFVAGFLTHLETGRGNTLSTRNARLAAIHAFYQYAALRCPEHAMLIQRVLAIPIARQHIPVVSFLTRQETEALLAAPDRATRLGRRDHLLLLTAVQSGLRVSELASLTCADATLGTGAHLRCTGKGRKQRCTPLIKPTAQLLRQWITQRAAQPADPLFPSRSGGHLSRDAIADLLAKHAAAATQACPSLAGKNITPHTLRHTAAMELQRRGRHLYHRALARPCQHPLHRHLPARRPQTQGTGPGPDRPQLPATRPLPARRQPTGLPREPLITPPAQTPHQHKRIQLRITRGPG